MGRVSKRFLDRSIKLKTNPTGSLELGDSSLIPPSYLVAFVGTIVSVVIL